MAVINPQAAPHPYETPIDGASCRRCGLGPSAGIHLRHPFTANPHYPDPKTCVCGLMRVAWVHDGEARVEIADESVLRPSHYGGGDNPYEAIKVIEAWDLNFSLGNVVKYVARAGRKGDRLEDLRKAARYLQFEIEREERTRG